MKLSFSTLGCPDWTFPDMYSVCCDLGFNGIEIRGIADEIYAPKITVFSPENITRTISKLEKANLSIPILTSGAYLVDNPDIAASEFEVKDYVMLASKLNVKYVRVLGEKTPEPVDPNNYDEALRRYVDLCKFAAQFGVDLLIETNGFLADSKVMKRFMNEADQPNMGVIWDIHHPFRFFGEAPGETVKNIGKWIKHTHIKDSIKGRNGKITYMLTGYGDVPVDDACRILKDNGYDGFYSYEWVKRWSKELAEPGVAFYQYLNYMRDLSL